MSIHKAEQEIIKYFVLKSRQDRMIWELSNPRKREKFYWNFAGIREFDTRCSQSIDYSSAKNLEDKLLHLGGAKTVYYIGSLFIGEIPLKQAVTYSAQGDICLIYCGNGIGYWQGEFDSRKRPHHLLIAN